MCISFVVTLEHESYQNTIRELLADQDKDWNPNAEVTVQTNQFEFLESEQEITEFSLEELRKFPRYLSDLTIKSNPSIITLDHYTYWAWTGAIAVGHPSRSGGGYRHTIGELAYLIHMMLFGMRSQFLTDLLIQANSGKDLRPIAELVNSTNKFSWVNPSLHTVHNMAHRVAATTGFAILDGLVKAHCNILEFETGDLKNRMEGTWREDPKMLTGTNFHDRIQIWRTTEATPTVAETISHINDLQRYDPDTICRSIEGVKVRLEKELTSTNHFLRLLHAQRDDNIHGQRGTRAIGSIVINLCCLLFWDIVKPDEFDRERNHAVSEIASWRDKQLYTTMVPETYLPLFRVD